VPSEKMAFDQTGKFHLDEASREPSITRPPLVSMIQIPPKHREDCADVASKSAEKKTVIRRRLCTVCEHHYRRSRFTLLDPSV